MIKNISATNGVIFSQQVLNKLIKDKGLDREKAYDLVQPIAIDSFEKEKNFMEELMANEEISKLLTEKEIKSLFDLEHFMKQEKNIYRRVGIK
jgi:adenylosuccinate lyase